MSTTEGPDGPLPKRWSAATVRGDLWVDPDADPREQHPAIVDERSNLLAYLGVYRRTLELKCDGLDPAQLARRSVPPSTMSLLGLVRHMAEVERWWFREVLAGERAEKRYRREDRPDAAFDDARGDAACVEEAFAAWREEIAFADDLVAATEDLGTCGRIDADNAVSVREVLVHMVEEYARHCGHADLLRERIDGRVGQ